VTKKDLNPLRILHVEDEENDAILLVKACERAGLPLLWRRLASAEDAKAYLLGHEKYSDRANYPLPQLLVLDLKLPGAGGFEFLGWLRAQENFDALPVLIFTASLLREDKTRALTLGANSYFVKPTSFEALIQMVESLNLEGWRAN
jgi:DNA-binding response OmpR family regulator